MEEIMLEKLAYSLGRNDEEPNIDLAKELSQKMNKKGIKEIVEGLNNPKEQIANDCSMTALSKIVSYNPEETFKNLDIIVRTYEKEVQ